MHYQRGISFAEAAGDRAVQARMLDLCGQATRDLGQVSDALHHWHAALAIFESLDDPRAAELRTRISGIMSP